MNGEAPGQRDTALHVPRQPPAPQGLEEPNASLQERTLLAESFQVTQQNQLETEWYLGSSVVK